MNRIAISLRLLFEPYSFVLCSPGRLDKQSEMKPCSRFLRGTSAQDSSPAFRIVSSHGPSTREIDVGMAPFVSSTGSVIWIRVYLYQKLVSLRCSASSLPEPFLCVDVLYPGPAPSHDAYNHAGWHMSGYAYERNRLSCPTRYVKYHHSMSSMCAQFQFPDLEKSFDAPGVISLTARSRRSQRL